MRNDHSTRQQGSIRTTLVGAFVLAVLLTAIITNGVTAYTSIQHEFDITMTQLEAVANLKTAQVETVLRDSQDEMQDIVERISPSLVDWMDRNQDSFGASSAFQEQLTEQLVDFDRNSRIFQAFYVLNLEGDVLASAGDGTDETIDFSNFSYIRRQQISDVNLEPIAYEPEQQGASIWVFQPIMLSGEWVGVLGARSSLARVNRIMLEKAGLGETVRSYLVDVNRVIVTDVQLGDYGAGTSVEGSLVVDEVFEERSAFEGQYTDFRGVPTIGAGLLMSDLRTVLVVEQDESEVFENIQQILLINVAVTVIAILVIISLASWLGNMWLVKPLRQLTTAAQSIATGNYDQHVSINTNNEMGSLARSFNTMSDQIRNHMTTLAENEERFRSMIESLPLGIVSIEHQDENMRVETSNPAWCAMFGVDSDDVIGKSIEAALPFLDETTMQHLKKAANGENWHGEISEEDENGLKFASEVYAFQTNPGRMVVAFVDTKDRKEAEVERQRLQQGIIEAQQAAIKELSTPIIPLMDGIIVMPLIGSIDTHRARDVMRALLAGISEHRAQIVIIDITGVPMVDTGVAAHLDSTVQAARLKGTNTIITGVSDAVAETIVDLGVEWHNVRTVRDLQTGLELATHQIHGTENAHSNGNSKTPHSNGYSRNGNGHSERDKLRALLEKFTIHKS